MSKRIYVHDLKDGYMIEDDIRHNGKILVKKGTVLTASLVTRIRQWFKDSDACVNICDEECSVADINDANAATCISEKLKQSTIAGIKSLYNATPEEFEEAFTLIKDCMGKIVIKVKKVTNLCYDVENLASTNKAVMEEHLFRVAKLAIALANVYNNTAPMSKSIELVDIGLAALLHDYGKSFKGRKNDIKKLKPDVDLFKKLNLNPQMLKQPFDQKFHSIYAYLALKESISEQVCKILLYSGLHNDAVNKLDKQSPEASAAKIITICYVYDSLLEAVVKNNVTLPLENVLSVIEQSVTNGTISQNAYQLFMDNILIYAPGTKVILTTGEYATVIGNTSHFPTKPMVYTDNSLGVPRVLDLSQATTITIKYIVNSSENVNGKIYEIQSTQLQKIVTTD